MNTKNIKSAIFIAVITFLVGCKKENNTPEEVIQNDVRLEISNVYQDKTIVLGSVSSTTATFLTSEKKQKHWFSEIKYVVSNIILITSEGKEFPYYVDNLDEGAFVINQEKPTSLQINLKNIPVGEYKQIKFGFGIKPELNKLREDKFPKFFKEAGANDTKMHWEWGDGYRFAKIEGFYSDEAKALSIHTGSTVKCKTGKDCKPEDYVQGVDAYREIVLSLPKNAIVGKTTPTISLKADWNYLLSGKEKIELDANNAKPNVHHSQGMITFVDNLSEMFSIVNVQN